jgi:hypothetical protein
MGSRNTLSRPLITISFAGNYRNEYRKAEMYKYALLEIAKW